MSGDHLTQELEVLGCGLMISATKEHIFIFHLTMKNSRQGGKVIYYGNSVPFVKQIKESNLITLIIS